MAKPLAITELVLRDAHQSLLATRLRIEDMLPIASALDQVGYWSIESWGGATFDSCIRYLGEDPWERLRALKKAMPNTRQQMLLRGQNLLGYRHYADDLVTKFVERAYANGIEVFRIFDAMNDMRNLTAAVRAAVAVGAHAQGTLSYTTSPVHTMQTWLDIARQLQDMGVHSICIKDMAGLLKPYDCEELIGRLRETVDLPIAMQCHATTGLSTATYQKAIDAGIDMLDTAISPMSMTYGHTATETIAAIVAGSERDTGLDLAELAPIAAYFRQVRQKYAQFEGGLKGVDARILLAQVPGGMLTNMENQLREQGAADRLDEVLLEIPKVRQDLGYIPLVTPTSQIVGTQAVLNVLTGERYQNITKETADVLRGAYGATAAPVNAELQTRVLEGEAAITCRPADALAPELETLTATLDKIAAERQITLAEAKIDDVLTYALFPQVGLKFLQHRGDASAFEPAPTAPLHQAQLHQAQLHQAQQSQAQQAQPAEAAVVAADTAPASGAVNTAGDSGSYQVRVNGALFTVEVAATGDVQSIAALGSEQSSSADTSAATTAATTAAATALAAPLAGNVVKVLVAPDQSVMAGEVVLILEAMKMETEVRATHSGTVRQILVQAGDAVQFGQDLMRVS